MCYNTNRVWRFRDLLIVYCAAIVIVRACMEQPLTKRKSSVVKKGNDNTLNNAQTIFTLLCDYELQEGIQKFVRIRSILPVG
jgi:hypothetical protein